MADLRANGFIRRWNLTMLLISLMDVDEIALSPIGLLA